MSRQWFQLDTAALIFPAVMRRNWSNAFRFAAVLQEEVDVPTLQQAVNDLKPRFPSLYVRLRTGMFWYALEETAQAPTVRREFAYPLTHMGRKELRHCCLRIYAYRNRLAVEFFHSLTDGTGGSVYLRSLLARYLFLRHGVTAQAPYLLTPEQTPTKDELEDSFWRNAAPYAMSRAEPNAYRLRGTRESDGFLHLVTGLMPAERLLAVAHDYHCTVTVFLAAVMAECILQMQEEKEPMRRRKPIKITIPINLRRLYASKTLRNFTLTLNPGVDPRNGSFTLQELCQIIGHQLAAEAIPQNMAARIAANVIPQRVLPLRLAPLFLKNMVMGAVYASSGECKGCLNISNLGVLELPEALMGYVQRLEFIIGVQRSYPNNCAVTTYRGQTCVEMIRNIRESELERRFFSRLVELGIPVEIESNER